MFNLLKLRIIGFTTSMLLCAGGLSAINTSIASDCPATAPGVSPPITLTNNYFEEGVDVPQTSSMHFLEGQSSYMTINQICCDDKDVCKSTLTGQVKDVKVGTWSGDIGLKTNLSLAGLTFATNGTLKKGGSTTEEASVIGQVICDITGPCKKNIGEVGAGYKTKTVTNTGTRVCVYDAGNGTVPIHFESPETQSISATLLSF